MEWYSKGIISAIRDCRQNSCLLVVYVKDISDASTATNLSWEDEAVPNILLNKLYVALQLTKDSVEFHQFSQLFPVFVVPSIFCISPTGDQLAVYSGAADPNKIVSTLSLGLQAVALEQSTVVGLNSCTEVSQSRVQEPTKMPNDASFMDEADKVHKAKEIRRRKQSDSDVNKSRKKKRFDVSSSSTIPIVSATSSPSTLKNCRIQIKLPDGHSTVIIVDSAYRVHDLRITIAKILGTAAEKVTLTCVYPRKVLGTDLDHSTIDQHGLVPSGVVMVKQHQTESEKQNSNRFIQLLLSLLHFLVQLLVSLKTSVVALFTTGGSNTYLSPKETNTNEEQMRFKRVKADDDGDDPNKTYNGNSTQQL